MTIRASLVCIAAALAYGVSAIPAGSIAVPLKRDGSLLAYLAKFSVGTPAQEIYLLIDTGSPTISFFDPRSNFCTQDDKPCADYGTFDNTSSSTSTYAGPGFIDQLIDYGHGDYLKDTVGIGGAAVPGFDFGYINEISYPSRKQTPAASIVGLGLDCFTGNTCDGPGPYLFPQFKNASKIDRSSVSIYLGPDDHDVANAEMVLGGSYDKAKIGGELFTMEMVDPHSALLTNTATNNVNVTSIEGVSDGKTVKSDSPTSEGTPFLLDTGAPWWSVPSDIFNLVSTAFGGLKAMTSHYTYIVDCKYRDPANSDGNITVQFAQGGKIYVPFHTLVTDFGNGTCVTAMNNGTGNLLGDPFLRNTYSVFDQESFTVSLAQVKHTTERDIVAIPEGGFKPAGRK